MKLKIISSQKVVLEEEDVQSVSIPGTEGQMQILPHHENLVSTIEIGSLGIETKGEKTTFLVNGGFVVIRDNEVLILVDNAEVPARIIKEEIEQAIQNATDKLSTITDPKELIRLEKQLRYERFKKDQVS